MIIERLGEASPVLHEMLEALGAEIDGDTIVIPTHGIRKTEDGLEVNVRHHYCRFDQGKWLGRLGEASPLLHEMLEALGAELDGDRIVIPNLGIRKTEDGIEVNVRHHYCRFDQGKWLPLRRVNAETVP